METQQKWHEKALTIFFFSIFAGAPILLSYILVKAALRKEVQEYEWGLYILFWILTILLLYGVTYKVLKATPSYWKEIRNPISL